MAGTSSEIRVDALTLPGELIAVIGQPAVSFTPNFITQLHDAGIDGAGVVPLIFDSDRRMLIGEHKVTPENTYGTWGQFTETVRWSPHRVEGLLMTAGRCIAEELGRDPNLLGLRHYGVSPAILSLWIRERQRMLAVTIPFIIPDEERDFLIAQPPDNHEIGRVRAVSPDEFLALPDKREGAASYTRELGKLGLFGPQPIGDIARFPGLPATTDPALYDTALSRLSAGLIN